MKLARFAVSLRMAVLCAILTVFATGAFAQEARKVKAEVKPTFPELARKLNLTSTVKVKVDISPTGTVTSAKALGGHPLFIDSAVEAAKKWRFEPAPSSTSQVLEFNFVNPKD